MVFAARRLYGLLSTSPEAARLFTPTFGRYSSLLRNQVLVDEVTDFSPVQLRCMAAITQPELRSFFACGDFNQRVTTWGMRSPEEMRWAVPDIETWSIAHSYRQSAELQSFSGRLAGKAPGESPSEAAAVVHSSSPEGAEHQGLPPALGKGLADTAAVSSWIAARIVEIETSLQQLPTIAILVRAENQVEPMATALANDLANSNIRVVACPEGRVRGSENEVRVFDVQHIKGLEFEAVFFVGIDRLAAAQPDLFDKYLYVGATRAATYLGLTCEGDLPPGLGRLDLPFTEHW